MKKILISCFLFLSIHALFAQGSKTTKPSKTQSQPNMDDLQKMMDDAMKDLTPEQKQMANDYIQKSMSGTIENQKNPDANKEYEEYLKDEEAEQANIGTISAKVIGIGGGNITSQSGKFSFDIPAGALTENIEFKLQETAGNSMSCGNGCKLLPSGLGFLKPVTFTTKYSKRDITGTAPELLIIIDKGDNIVTKSVVDKNNKSVSIKISNSGNQWITTAAARLVLEPEIREVSRGQTIEIKLKDIDYDPTGKYDEDLYFGIHADRTIDILDSFTITKWKLNEKTAMVLNDKYGSLVKYQKNSVLYTAPQALPLLDRMVTISVELEQNRTKQKVILITYLFLLADDYFILKIDMFHC